MSKIHARLVEKKEMKFTLTATDALIITDVQKDFCPGGALPVPQGDHVVSVLNEYVSIFRRNHAHIFATRDWHPPNHISFKPYGGIWPIHCVQGSEGAEFHPDLGLTKTTTIISKATLPHREAYSGFDGTELREELEQKGVMRLFVGGLATDYCVKHTVLDALNLGFATALLVDAIRGVNIYPRDSENAIREMIERKAKKVKVSILSQNN